QRIAAVSQLRTAPARAIAPWIHQRLSQEVDEASHQRVIRRGQQLSVVLEESLATVAPLAERPWLTESDQSLAQEVIVKWPLYVPEEGRSVWEQAPAFVRNENACVSSRLHVRVGGPRNPSTGLSHDRKALGVVIQELDRDLESITLYSIE